MTKRKNIILLILINVFFFEYALVFWGRYRTAIAFEYILLFSVPLCAFYFRKIEWELKWQMMFINLLFLTLWLEGIICNYSSKQRVPLIVCGFICLLGGIIVHISYSWRDWRTYARVKDYIGLLVVCFLFILFSLETVTEVPAYDGGAYYAWSINKQAVYFDFSVLSIAESSRLATHTSVGYGLFTLMGELLSPLNAVGVHLVNILLAIFSIIAFYKLLKALFPTKDKPILTLAAAIYAFSPYLLGMVGTINVDVPGIYFLVIMLCCYVKGYWLLELFFAWNFICTKEPNGVYYTFFLAGILLYELLNRKVKKTSEVKKTELQRIFAEMLPRAALLLFWVLYFFKSSLTSWVTLEQDSGVHRIGFSVQNLAGKLRQVFLMNFNWLFTFVFLSGVIFVIISKRHFSSKKAIIPLCMTMVGVLCFNIFYIDYLHPRYIAIGAEIVLLMGIIVLVEVFRGRIQYICAILMSILLFMQSYVSVDPVTIQMFTKVGRNQNISFNLVNSETARFDDGNIYNREYSYYYKALSKVLAAAGYDQSAAVVFSYFENIPESYGYSEILFWNTDRMKLQAGETGNSIPLVIASSIEELEDCEKIFYVVPFWVSEDNELLQDIKVENVYEVNYRTVHVKCYVGQVE